MKPAIFDYHRASTLEHACELLGSTGDDAKILAGGQSLIAAMNFRLARPRVLIDVTHIADRNQVSEEDFTTRTAGRHRPKQPATFAEIRSSGVVELPARI